MTELRRAASTVSERIAALEQADADVERTLDERIANVAGAVDELGAGLSSALARVAESERGLASVQVLAEDGSARLCSQLSELKQQVTALSTQLGALEHGGGEIGHTVPQLGKSVHELAERVSEKDDALPALSQQVDALAADVESAVTSFVEKEREVAALQGHAAESSTRIETSWRTSVTRSARCLTRPLRLSRRLRRRWSRRRAGLTLWQVVSSGSKPRTSTRSRPS